MSSNNSSDAACSRRGFLSVSGALASTVLLAEARPAASQQADQQPDTTAREQTAVAPGAVANPPVEVLANVLWDLVAANRIIAHFGLIDAYGHVAVRNPSNPNSYLMASAEIVPPPGEVNLDNLGEFDFDNRPMDTKGRHSWPERFIFGEIFRRRPDVGAALHCHAPAIVLIGSTGEPLRPIIHVAGFMGLGIPVFDLSKALGEDTNLIINNSQRAHALADALGDKPAVVMRGHGCAVVGKNLPEAVARVVYLNTNCQLQAQVLGRNIQYLSPGEAHLSESQGGYLPDWVLWKAEVMGRSPSLYSSQG